MLPLDQLHSAEQICNLEQTIIGRICFAEFHIGQQNCENGRKDLVQFHLAVVIVNNNAIKAGEIGEIIFEKAGKHFAQGYGQAEFVPDMLLFRTEGNVCNRNAFRKGDQFVQAASALGNGQIGIFFFAADDRTGVEAVRRFISHLLERRLKPSELSLNGIVLFMKH